MINIGKELSIRDLHVMAPAGISGEFVNDFYISRIRFGRNLNILKKPCRFNCCIAYFCTKGHFRVEINSRSFEIRENSLMLYAPGNLVRVDKIEDVRGSECIILAVSRKLMTSLRFDFARFYDESLMTLTNPCIELNEQERAICTKYYELAQSLLSSNPAYLEDSILSLGSSIFYFFANLWSERIQECRGASDNSIRAKMVFENFLKLVHDNHLEERNVAFYADRLCLTPKYLSQLVNKVSGQSAPQWIDAFIIMDAKNLLKYSEMDIKEIVYRLNFRSQAIFSRFFKAHTGQTPIEYRKSI